MLVVEYDGTRYRGFQLQDKVPTIQGELEIALKRLTGEDIRAQGASRTDTGVHAKGQVVSFQTRSALPPQSFVSGLNHYLPEDIAVTTTQRVSDDFDVRHAATRQYGYFISNARVRSPLQRRFTHLVTQHLDIEAMDVTCQDLLGEHDFRSFATSLGSDFHNTVRRVYQAKVSRKGSTVSLNITANSFLPHQVRNTAGALIKVGLNKLDRKEFQERMMAKIPGLLGPTAPPQGLFLLRVNYTEPCMELGDERLQ
ncbi:tRNA pseudouridine(38-40) synthase TruA [Chloroflexota bacterium]